MLPPCTWFSCHSVGFNIVGSLVDISERGGLRGWGAVASVRGGVSRPGSSSRGWLRGQAVCSYYCWTLLCSHLCCHSYYAYTYYFLPNPYCPHNQLSPSTGSPPSHTSSLTYCWYPFSSCASVLTPAFTQALPFAATTTPDPGHKNTPHSYYHWPWWTCYCNKFAILLLLSDSLDYWGCFLLRYCFMTSLIYWHFPATVYRI